MNTGYTDAIQENFGQTQQHYATEALRNLVSMSPGSIGDVEKGAENLTANGTYNGKMQDANIENWTEKAEALSDRIRSVEIESLKVNLDNLTLKTSSKLSAKLISGNVTERVWEAETVSGVQDPLASNLYPVNFSSCRYEKPVEKVDDGNLTNGTARGKPVKTSDPGSVSNKADKIIYDEDITRYSPTNITGFAGYISREEPGNPEDFNENYVAGLPELPEFETGQNALIADAAWKSNINYSVEEQCYFSTPHQDTPSIKDRIKEVQGTSGEGIYTFVDTSETGENSSKSNIAYQRVRGGANLVQIKGVSTGEGKTWSYFKVGKSLAEKTTLETLIK